MVNWEVVCLPKSEGGLGLRKVKVFNEACMMKLGWSAITLTSLRANWFRVRHFRNSPIWFSSNLRAGSCIWKKIRSLAPILQRGSSWTLGNRHSILLWYDNWIDHDPIALRFPLVQFSERDRVADPIQGNSWHFPPAVPDEVRGFLLQQSNIISTRDPSVPDLLSWKGSSSGSLSLKSTWDSLRSLAAKVDWHKLVWNNLISPRLSCFNWRLLLRKTPTDSMAMQKGCSLLLDATPATAMENQTSIFSSPAV